MNVIPAPRVGRATPRRWGRALTLSALVALVALPAWGAAGGRKGTSGASELLIQVGPRGSALSGTAASDASGIEAIFWNPAGLADVQHNEAIFSHTAYLAGMKLNYAAAATRVGALGTIAVSAKVLSVGDILVTTEEAPDGTGQVLQPTFVVLGASWAREMTDRVRFGMTAGIVNEHIAEVTASGLALDVGVQYDTGWRGLRFGIAMKNFGPKMAFSGSGLDQAVNLPAQDPTASKSTLRFTSASFELPSYFSMAATYDLYQYGDNRLHLLGSFQNNNFFGDNFAGGLEWNFRRLVSARGSWFGTLTSATDPLRGDESMSFTTGDDVYSGYALGLGILVPTGGSKLGVDLSWRPVRNYFDNTLEIGLNLKF